MGNDNWDDLQHSSIYIDSNFSVMSYSNGKIWKICYWSQEHTRLRNLNKIYNSREKAKAAFEEAFGAQS